VTELSWARCEGEDCLRLAGLTPGAAVQVRPGAAGQVGGAPPMAGRFILDGGDLCFVPRFPFVEGTTYAVSMKGVEVGALARPRVDRPVTTEVLEIHPTLTDVPRNLLRFYVVFSAPMSEGHAARHITLIDEAGQEMVGALLATEHELWDAGRRRLTALLDPARIKRGLVPHLEAGYPLELDSTFRFVVGAGFRDSHGVGLRASAGRTYRVRPDERRLLVPEDWQIAPPSVNTVAPLEVLFDRPLDPFLSARCLRVLGPDSKLVAGTPNVGRDGTSWRLTPQAPWAVGSHRLLIDPVLEDLAGNSVERVFDRDMTRPEDAPRGDNLVAIEFCPH